MKKNFEKKKTTKFSENESCLKLPPELPRNHVSRGVGVAMDRQTTGQHHRVTCRVAPC